MLTIATGALRTLLLIFVLAPVVVVVLVSVTDRNFVSLPSHGISLRHYAELFGSERWTGAALHSLLVALCATTLATVIGALCAIGAWQIRSRWSAAIRSAMLLPLIVPVVIQALGLYRMYIPLGLLDTFLGISVAQAVLGLPYVVISTSAALAQVDRRIEQAARSLGAGLLETTLRVIVPAALPGIVSGALICFVFCFDEVVLTVFLTGLRTTLLPKVIWDGVQDDMKPVIAAACTSLMAVVGLMLTLQLVFGWLRARRTFMRAA
jgi:putative spermidine/putrescine transport system permease protein